MATKTHVYIAGTYKDRMMLQTLRSKLNECDRIRVSSRWMDVKENRWRVDPLTLKIREALWNEDLTSCDVLLVIQDNIESTFDWAFREIGIALSNGTRIIIVSQNFDNDKCFYPHHIERIHASCPLENDVDSYTSWCRHTILTPPRGVTPGIIGSRAARIAARATNFVAQRHPDPRHPIGVMNILINEFNVSNALIPIIALLHDTLESTDTTLEELVQEFGQLIALFVKECTDDTSRSLVERKRAQVVNAHTKSTYVSMVIMADKLYHLRSIAWEIPSGWSVEMAQGYFIWALAVMRNLGGIDDDTLLVVNTFINTATFAQHPGIKCIDPEMTLDRYYTLLEEKEKEKK